jgi:hypothetical protein
MTISHTLFIIFWAGGWGTEFLHSCFKPLKDVQWKRLEQKEEEHLKNCVLGLEFQLNGSVLAWYV